jgi:hypothetical protein
MMQSSLPRLIDGIIAALRDTVLPALDDAYVRTQVTAAIELLDNLATRVEWRRADLAEIDQRAEAALAAAIAVAGEMAAELPPRQLDDAAGGHDAALQRVSTGLRWCDRHGRDDAAAPLIDFAAWHVEHESARLRTGISTT